MEEALESFVATQRSFEDVLGFVIKNDYNYIARRIDTHDVPYYFSPTIVSKIQRYYNVPPTDINSIMVTDESGKWKIYVCLGINSHQTYIYDREKRIVTKEQPNEQACRSGVRILPHR